MKAMLSAIALSFVVLPFAGCETLSETAGENRNRLLLSIDTNGKQIVDDAQRSLYIDRPSWLSRHPIPNH